MASTAVSAAMQVFHRSHLKYLPARVHRCLRGRRFHLSTRRRVYHGDLLRLPAAWANL